MHIGELNKLNMARRTATGRFEPNRIMVQGKLPIQLDPWLERPEQ